MELIEKIKYQVPIANLSERLGLDRREHGRACPFCADPACVLALQEENNRFETTLCEVRGAQTELAQQVLRKSKEDAIRWLSKEYRIEEDRLRAGEILKQWQSEKKSLSLDDVFGSGTDASMGAGTSAGDEEIYAFMMDNSPMNETALSFLLRRGYNEELIETYGLGWVENPGRIFEDAQKRFGKEALGSAGLLDRRKEFLFNRHRLLFPFHKAGRIAYLRARRIDDGKPRYLSLTRKTPVVFPEQIVARLEDGDTLYLTMDLSDCFALLNRGFKAVAIVDHQVFPEAELEPLRHFDLVALGDKDTKGHAFNRWLLKVFAKWSKDLRLQELPPAFESWNDFVLDKKK